MRAIPKKLLIHSGTIKSITAEDRWGNVITTLPVNLKYIRLESIKTIVKDSQNNEIQLNTLLFFDCKNSEPKDVSFTKDTIITINGVDHTVKTIEPLYDVNKLHHYEVGLIYCQ
jgi:hypothetical protein